jgi:hypothetical protein
LRQPKSQLLPVEIAKQNPSLLIRSSQNKLEEVKHKSTPLLLSTLAKLSKKTSLAIENSSLPQSEDSKQLSDVLLKPSQNSQLLQPENLQTFYSSLFKPEIPLKEKSKSKKSRHFQSANLQKSDIPLKQSKKLKSGKSRHFESAILQRSKESSDVLIETSTILPISYDVSTFISQVESPIKTISTTLKTTISKGEDWTKLDRSDQNVLQLALLFPGSKVILQKKFVVQFLTFKAYHIKRNRLYLIYKNIFQFFRWQTSLQK